MAGERNRHSPSQESNQKCATVPVTKPGGGQSFDSSMLVAEAKFLPDPGEVVAAYRIIPPLPCGLILQDLQPADHLLPPFPVFTALRGDWLPRLGIGSSKVRR